MLRNAPAPDPGRVIAKAVARAADALGLSQSEIATVLGSSAASVSRAFAGQRGIDPASAEGRHALLFVRVFRSLDPLVGGDAAKGRAWLHSGNRHLGGVPAALMTTTPGLVHVADYLDAMRGTL
jgi:hypothetical protein